MGLQWEVVTGLPAPEPPPVAAWAGGPPLVFGGLAGLCGGRYSSGCLWCKAGYDSW